MDNFINRVITVEDFERNYLSTFINETESMENTFFEILNGVFEAVDCYWHFYGETCSWTVFEVIKEGGKVNRAAGGSCE